MGRIKDLQQYSGSVQRQDVWFMIDGDSFQKGMKMSAQQIYTLVKGADGRNIEIQNSGTYIQWRQSGDTSWTNLVQLSTLKGVDGKALEIQTADGYIQTRLAGGEWANLIAVADLKGEKGDDALPPVFSFQITALASGAAPTASVTGTYPNLTVALGLPKGQDAALPNIGFALTALAPDEEATASVTGEYPDLTVSLGIPRGQNAPAPAFAVAVEGKAAGTAPEAYMTGDYPDLTLAFRIPAGARGPEGRGPVVLANGNYGNWDAGAGQYVDSGVAAVAAVSEAAVAFTQAEVRANIATGELLKVLFGKIRKWFTDMGALAFKNTVSWDTDIDGKPDALSAFSNDEGYITGSAIEAHNEDAEAHGDIREAVTDGVQEAKDYTDDQIEALDFTPYEETSNKVSVSSQSTATQYANAKSVWDLIQDIIATIPAGGLKVPLSLDEESDLPDPATLAPGDYFFLQDMDITAPEHSGRAWVNYADPGDPETALVYYKVSDQYQHMDGDSIVETGSGAWQVSTTWLAQQLASALGSYVPTTRTVAGLDLSADRDAAALKAALGLTNDFDATYKALLDFIGSQTVTSLASMIVTKQIVTATVSTNQALSIASVSVENAAFVVIIKATADITVALPDGVGYRNMYGPSLSVANGGVAIVHLFYNSADSLYYLNVGEARV